MIIEHNGVKIEANVSGSILKYRVLEQTAEFTRVLKSLKMVVAGGFALKVNERPSYNHQLKRFFVRGSNTEKNDVQVKCKFNNASEAQDAIKWLAECCKKVRHYTPEELQPTKIQVGNANVAAGGTAHFRMCIIPKEIAQELSLTGKALYPDEPAPWVPTKPFVDENVHYTEHAAQACDVMNKSIMTERQFRELGLDDGVMNAHKVTPQQAKKAVELLKKSFKQAQDGGFSVAWWRLVTFLRSDDSKY